MLNHRVAKLKAAPTAESRVFARWPFIFRGSASNAGCKLQTGTMLFVFGNGSAAYWLKARAINAPPVALVCKLAAKKSIK